MSYDFNFPDKDADKYEREVWTKAMGYMRPKK